MALLFSIGWASNRNGVSKFTDNCSIGSSYSPKTETLKLPLLYFDLFPLYV